MTPPVPLVNLPRARAVMREQALDALVATTHKNLYYLSGHMPDSVLGDFQDLTAAAILPAQQSIAPALVASDYDLAFLVTHPTWMPRLRMDGAKERSSASFLLEVLSRGIGIETALREPLRALYRDTRAAVRPDVLTALEHALAESLPEARARVGFDDLRVGLEMQRRFSGRIELVDALHHFRKVRMVKTGAELALLRKAAAINDVAVMEAAAAATAGQPMSAMVDAYRLAMVRQGGAFMGQRGMLFGAGPDGGFVLDNAYAEAKVLEVGDVIVFDCIGKYRLYHADIARTGIVGEESARLSRLHGVVREALQASEAKLRPGVNTEELKAIAADVLDRHRLDRNLTTLAWHNVGLDVVEYAHPSERSQGWIVEPGMVMNFELFHRDPDLGGVHLEDSVHVTDDGLEYLSNLPRELLVTGARA
ncbi:MAG: aminopeptidase P family protein [Burkholderiales bacterium]|nr:MAG: aminopeptidase P family protein [Burkholderiales bacterium]